MTDTTSAEENEPVGELEALRQEVARLKARVRELENERLDLLRRAADRDFERPPHYQ